MAQEKHNIGVERKFRRILQRHAVQAIMTRLDSQPLTVRDRINLGVGKDLMESAFRMQLRSHQLSSATLYAGRRGSSPSTRAESGAFPRSAPWERSRSAGPSSGTRLEVSSR